MNHSPELSVLLPVYNAEKYLRSAIDSILNQTYRGFELIIINDGSTDGSEDIVRSYDDNRIVYVLNKKNIGLIDTLNNAVDRATGKFIARMDADDIALSTRFEKQMAFLKTNPQTALLATVTRFIDLDGNDKGEWELDKKTISDKAIRNTMIRENCIAHPTIMGRSQVFREFKYRAYQKNMEDYDLWLRVLSAGLVISKINEPLLLYRLHDESVTKKYIQKSNFYFKLAGMKRRYLMSKLKSFRYNMYDIRIKLSMLADVIMGLGKGVKKLITKQH